MKIYGLGSVGIFFYSAFLSAAPLRIVLSGGSATGKSSIIQELETRGEFVVRETAMDYILFQRAKNIPAPWEGLNFQTNINLIQFNREENVNPAAKLVFQDRSLIDSLGYCRHRNQPLPLPIQAQVATLDLEKRYFKIVFFVQKLTRDLNLTERFDLDQSDQIDRALRETYSELGYQIIDIAPDSLEKRADAVLNHLSQRGIWSPHGRAVPLLPN
jgi:predicted ATPase